MKARFVPCTCRFDENKSGPNGEKVVPEVVGTVRPGNLYLVFEEDARTPASPVYRGTSPRRKRPTP